MWLKWRIRNACGVWILLEAVVLSGLGPMAAAGQTVTDEGIPRLRRSSLAAESATLPLPDAPVPQTSSSSPTPKANPCPQPGAVFWRRPDRTAALPGAKGEGVHPAVVPCQRSPLNALQKFINGPKADQLTPRDKAWLAVRNVVDPFNLVTIAGEAGISVALDSHSPYGPGMTGYGRYVGVSFTEDMTGEFFGTFLIPSLTHQDPHYHRMPGHSIPRRTAHAIAQIFWTESDTGQGMPNYANLAGFAIEDEIGNLYVPGRQTDVPATAKRYAIGLASAPIGNLVDEFLPDVASHVHVQIVILQRIINQVARTATQGSTTSTTPSGDLMEETW